MLSLLIDGLLILLLAATVIYCAVLNRRLSVLRKSEGELQAMIASFNMATARAESSIDSLKKTAGSLQAKLTDQVSEAKALYDDLAFIIDRGDALADRLTNRAPASSADQGAKKEMSDSRADSRDASVTQSGPARSEEDDLANYSKAEQELLKILKANASS